MSDPQTADDIRREQTPEWLKDRDLYGGADNIPDALRNIARDIPQDVARRITGEGLGDAAGAAAGGVGLGSATSDIRSIIDRILDDEQSLSQDLTDALRDTRDSVEGRGQFGAAAGGAEAFDALGSMFWELLTGGDDAGGGDGGRSGDQPGPGDLDTETRRKLKGTKRPWRSPESEEAPFSPFRQDEVHQRVMSMQPAERARLQEQLVRAGALTGDFDYGGFDDATARALNNLVSFANAHEIGDLEEAAAEMQEARLWAEDQGMPWQDVNPGARREGGDDGPTQRFQQPVYEKPDPARLRTDVREMFQGTVGRDPTDEELDRFVNMLADADRKSFESEVDKAEMEFDARQQEKQRIQATPEEMTTAEQILEGSEISSHPTEPPRFSQEALERRTAQPEEETAGAEGGRAGGGEVQGTDPVAGVEEALNEHLRGERQGQEQAEERRAGTQLASRAFSRIGRAMGGS